jgi:hypothetical protein
MSTNITPIYEEETTKECAASAETMEVLGKRIKALVEKGDNMLASAAACAHEARQRYDAGETDGYKTWGEWWCARTGLSDRRGQQLLKIGRADNPVQAAVEHNKKNRDAVAKHRAKKTELRNSRPAKADNAALVEPAVMPAEEQVVAGPSEIETAPPEPVPTASSATDDASIDEQVEAIYAAWERACPKAQSIAWERLWDVMQNDKPLRDATPTRSSPAGDDKAPAPPPPAPLSPAAHVDPYADPMEIPPFLRREPSRAPAGAP